MPSVSPTPAQQAEMVRLYVEDDLSIVEIVERTYWSRTVVARSLREAGVQTRHRGGHPPSVPVDRLVELYRDGRSFASVGREVGLHWTTVRAHLRRAGVPARARRDAVRLECLEKISRDGRLSRHQAAALAALEAAYPKALLTSEIAARTGVADQEAVRFAVRRLVEYGLVTGKRRTGTGAGAGNPYEWVRTDLRVSDVLTSTVLAESAVRGKPKKEDELPIGPLRDWLNEWIAREDRKAEFMRVTSEDAKDAVISVVAAAIGVSDKRLYALRFDQQSISVSLADRVLTNAGRGVGLSDLWPDRFPDFELVAA